ncbi:threonine ammonia-lyase [Geodermatophilus amargosae]|uniref:threonine ammonia-lyase n=1 Tax=Geodermatophilus amargosae TaxID=1296565 RepID=UPI0034DF88CE
MSSRTRDGGTSGGLLARHVAAAAAALEGVVERTPMLSSPALDAAVGAEVVCKAENLQRTNSFKFRGAYYHLLALSGERRGRGVVGASSGNHAQALALGGRLLDAPVHVVVPEDLPDVKLAAIARLGADIVTYRRGVDDRDRIVARLAHTHGLAVVPSADSLAVMAGAGTVGLELMQDAPGVGALLVPVGGGGLAAGCATVVTTHYPGVKVVGVEPAAGNDTLLSLRAGQLMAVPPPSTIADGLRHTAPAAGPFMINQRLLHDVVTVTDDEIAAAMALAFQHLKVVVEPSGATALAALLAGKAPVGSGRTGVILSGGNVDWTAYRSLTNGKMSHALPGLRGNGASLRQHRA